MMITFTFGQVKPELLRAVEVIDSQSVLLASSYAQVFDSLNLKRISNTNDLTMLLSRQAPMHFKHYGPGLLATPTFRGGDANHTQVLWNGLPINSPMLGTIDISTLPVSTFNTISILGANASNLHSTGGLGGSISLEQDVSYNKSYSWVESHIGSAETHGAATGFNFPFKIGQTKLVYRLHSDFINAKNSFSYVDLLDPERSEKINGPAAFSRENINMQLAISPKKTWQASFIYWYNTMDRELPNPVNLPFGSAVQKDIAHRAMIDAIYQIKSSIKLNFKTFFEDNSNQFTDTSFSIDNDNRYQQFQQEASINWIQPNWPTVEARARYSLVSATTRNYAGKQNANGLSVVLLSRYAVWKNQLQFEGGYRLEQFIADRAMLPFGGIRLKHHRLAPFYLFASASETVRFANLNERYWIPGGNINLEAERGSSIEGGLGYDKHGLKFGLTTFEANYVNRIRWLPDGSIFTPTNVSYARSRGVESFVSFKKQFRNHHFDFFANATYLNALGRTMTQNPLYFLSFIPQQSANASIIYSYNNWSVRYAIRYMGKRFISNDETAYMPGFLVQDCGLQYMINTKDVAWIWAFNIENLADWNYQVMPWRPMPGRMFNCSIRMQWND